MTEYDQIFNVSSRIPRDCPGLKIPAVFSKDQCSIDAESSSEESMSNFIMIVCMMAVGKFGIHE